MKNYLIALALILCPLILTGHSEAAVTFSTPDQLITTAVFDSTGSHVIELRVSDSVKVTTDTVTIIVNTSIIQPRVIAGTANGIAGNSVDVTISLATGTTDVSSLQFDLALPLGVSSGTVTVGSAAEAAVKSVSGSMVGSALRVLVFGLNQNPIGSGPIAIIRLWLSPALGTVSRNLVLSGVTGSDAAGASVSMTGVNGSIAVTANSAPVISISASTTTITLPAVNSIILTGTASDDGAPNPPGKLIYTWSIR